MSPKNAPTPQKESFSFTYDVPDMEADHTYRYIMSQRPEWTGDAYLLDHLTRLMCRLAPVDDRGMTAKIVVEEHRKFLTEDPEPDKDKDPKPDKDKDPKPKEQMVMIDNYGFDAMIKEIATCPNRQRWRGNLSNKDGTASPVKFMRKADNDNILWNLTGEFGTDKMIWVPVTCPRNQKDGKDVKAASLYGVGVRMIEEFAKVNEGLSEILEHFFREVRQEYNRPGIDPSKIKVRLEGHGGNKSIEICLKIPK